MITVTQTTKTTFTVKADYYEDGTWCELGSLQCSNEFWFLTDSITNSIEYMYAQNETEAIMETIKYYEFNREWVEYIKNKYYWD